MESFSQLAECALGGFSVVHNGTPGKESSNVQIAP
jgi:hypothetical protein